jgi:hypothetical protein
VTPAAISRAACLRHRGGRHVPDFLLVRANRTVTVVNVKPAARLAGMTLARYQGTGLAEVAARPGLPLPPWRPPAGTPACGSDPDGGTTVS